MTLIEKIDYLLKKKGLNKRQLSIKAEIPYSTIDNWYKRGYESMTLSTFKKLCRFFDVDMTSMAFDELEIQPYDPERMHTTSKERELIIKYRQADEFDQTSVCRTLHIEESDTLKKGESA